MSYVGGVYKLVYLCRDVIEELEKKYEKVLMTTPHVEGEAFEVYECFQCPECKHNRLVEAGLTEEDDDMECEVINLNDLKRRAELRRDIIEQIE
jgi:hypothetical protein